MRLYDTGQVVALREPNLVRVLAPSRGPSRPGTVARPATVEVAFGAAQSGHGALQRGGDKVAAGFDDTDDLDGDDSEADFTDVDDRQTALLRRTFGDPMGSAPSVAK